MFLHIAALAARKILDTAACGFERIMNHQFKIRVWRLDFGVARSSRLSIHRSAVVRDGLALDDNFLPRQSQVDANVKWFSFLVMTVRQLDRHAASDNAVIESFEFPGLRANPILYFRGMLHVAKSDLQWKRHGLLPEVSCFVVSDAIFRDADRNLILAVNPFCDVTAITFGSDYTHCAVTACGPK